MICKFRILKAADSNPLAAVQSQVGFLVSANTYSIVIKQNNIIVYSKLIGANLANGVLSVGALPTNFTVSHFDGVFYVQVDNPLVTQDVLLTVEIANGSQTNAVSMQLPWYDLGSEVNSFAEPIIVWFDSTVNPTVDFVCYRKIATNEIYAASLLNEFSVINWYDENAIFIGTGNTILLPNYITKVTCERVKTIGLNVSNLKAVKSAPVEIKQFPTINFNLNSTLTNTVTNSIIPFLTNLKRIITFTDSKLSVNGNFYLKLFLSLSSEKFEFYQIRKEGDVLIETIELNNVFTRTQNSPLDQINNAFVSLNTLPTDYDYKVIYTAKVNDAGFPVYNKEFVLPAFQKWEDQVYRLINCTTVELINIHNVDISVEVYKSTLTSTVLQTETLAINATKTITVGEGVYIFKYIVGGNTYYAVHVNICSTIEPLLHLIGNIETEDCGCVNKSISNNHIKNGNYLALYILLLSKVNELYSKFGLWQITTPTIEDYLITIDKLITKLGNLK